MTNVDDMTDNEQRARRIADARRALAERYAEDPEGTQRFQLRMGRLAAAAKRERERVAYLVLNQKRPTVTVKKRHSRSKGTKKTMPITVDPSIEASVELRERWRHKTGTPETCEAAAHTHQGSLAQLHANGTIDREQLEDADEIYNVHRSLIADVDVAIASLEARVDQSRRYSGVAESVNRVRKHLAYDYWREMLPAPKQLVLDMIVGDAIGYTVAARRYGVHNRKAKRLLIEAIDRWRECVDRAFRLWSPEDIEEIEEKAAAPK